MIRRWLAEHRSGAIAGLSGTVIVAVVAVIAIASGGYTAQRVDLGDGAVWVSNAARQVVGRANTQVLELNTVVDSASSTVDIVQRGTDVLVDDAGNATLEIIDPATSEVSASVPLPPGAGSVAIAGKDAVIVADGDVWTTPLTELDAFQSAAKPNLSLGAGTITTVSPAGTMFAFTPSTGTLTQVDVRSGTVTSTTAIDGLDQNDDFAITSAGGAWALLDVTAGSLDTAAGRSNVGTLVGKGESAVLQQAADGPADVVLVAYRAGLISVPLHGGSPTRLVSDRSGTPAPPVVVGSCMYAAWADGAAWRRCGSGNGVLGALAAASGALRLVFRVNQHNVVLNDTASGASWAVQDDNRLIDNWAELIDAKRTNQVVEQNDPNSPPQYEKAQQPPTAVDDSFGARPGRVTPLPVLLNDFDPNGDVLVISAFVPIDPARGRVDLVADGQQLQLTLPQDASGRLQFGYTISDGRGGTASATVTVDVRTPEENGPPKQVRPTHAAVAVGGRVSTSVLTDWVDPDGDPIYLAAASAAAPDLVSFKPDGAVVFSDVDGGEQDVAVGLTVSDGRAEGAGTLGIAVRSSGTVPITADAFVVQAFAGDELSVNPLAHAHGGSGILRLASVPAKPDVTVTPDFDGGTFRFVSSSIGTHYLDYSVTDGLQTATGLVRVDVAPPPSGSTTPITVPHTAFVHSQSDTTIDVVATDIDPTGGVLLVTDVTGVEATRGVRVEILEQHLLRITLTAPLENGSASFGYRVSNGLASADGTVQVIEVPRPERRQAPIARPDTASVRVGDVIDIPVLANDEQPDGDPLSLDPQLPERPEGSGLLFVSGNVLRYLAPDRPGDYTAVYRVDAPDGQFATAAVTISVRERDPAANNPPIPRTVTSRVLAGERVRVVVPLSGIDPDGDSVQLIGQDSNPEKGAVVQTGPGWFDYVAGDYSAGTDSFGYAVIDALGARATGTIRIGITPRSDTSAGPVAVEDVVTARPGSTVLVRALANDSDPEGGALTVTEVTPTGEGTAKTDGQLVTITVPDADGDYGFIYTAANARGGSSSTFITVRARSDAPLSRPEARDTVLSLSDVLDRQSVDVDVLANVFFADGPVKSLGLSLLPGYGSATVTAAHHIRVRIHDEGQVIPFKLTHPKDASVVSYAFVWVPGYNDALPQLRAGAPPLSVASEGVLNIDINKYVVAVGGKKVRLTDSGTVRATHSDGSDLVAGDGSLRFRSADAYFGPASLSFQVTDGSSRDDPNGRTATIVLPITVTPRENQPPVFTGGLIEFEPEQQKVIDLGKLTTYPYPDDRNELAFTVLDPQPEGFSASLSGSTLTLTAARDAKKGTQASVLVGVRDALNAGSAGRISLRVVPSTRPLAVPAADSAVVKRGETTTVDVLANDGAANPFPSTPLRVIAVRGLDAGSLPAGVSIVPSADSSSLRVSVSASAAPVDTNLQYQVADATGDPDRFAWGSVRISVQDRPEPVTGLQVTGFGDRSLTVAFQPGAFNNSPITGYDVAMISAATGAVVSTTPCAATTCTVPTPGNGDANAVRVQVVAKNAIGSSDATVMAQPVWSDVVPGAPTGLSAAPLDGGLRLSWDAVNVGGSGTPVRSYVVTVGGTALGELPAAQLCAGARCTVDAPGLANGSSVAFSVSARNGAYPALSSWAAASGSGVPFGPPSSGGIRVEVDAGSGVATVSFDAFTANGDAIGGYYVQRLADGTPAPSRPEGAAACSVSSPAPGTVTAPSGGTVKTSAGAPVTFTGLTADDTVYNFIVWGYNRAGCAATAVGSSVVRPGPGSITAVDAGLVDTAYTRDLVIRSVSSSGSSAYYNLRLVDAGGNPVTEPTRFRGSGTPRTIFSGHSFGETFRFQVQACSFWNSCGPWSRTYPDAPAASLTWEVTGLQYAPENGTWTWTNAPDNGADHPAAITCGLEGQPGVAASGNSCIVSGAKPTSRVWLGITIDQMTRTYTQ